MQMRAVVVFAVAASVAASCAQAAPAGANATASQPNFVIFLTDDQDVLLSSLAYMPKTKKLLVEQGMTFPSAFAAVPVCCPSRSSFWTGKLQQNTRAYNNSIVGNCNGHPWQQGPERSTVAVLLQNSSGYANSYAGKYLNNYGDPRVGGTAHVPPGWLNWQGLVGNSRYYNYELSNNGVSESHGADYFADYLPMLVYNRSVSFITKYAGRGTPYMVALSTPACHQPADPAPQYQNLYPGIKAPRQPNFNVKIPNTHWFESVQGVSGPLDGNQQEWVDLLYRRRLQTLATVDDMVEGVINTVAAAGQLDNTYFIYTADNGYHLGQAGLALDKRQPWDYDARIPFIVRGPGIPAGTVNPTPISHVDVVPTLLELAGAPIPADIDGVSILPLLRGAGARTAPSEGLLGDLAVELGVTVPAEAEGDPAVAVRALSQTQEEAAALTAANWTRQTIFYSYHGESDGGQPASCTSVGITDPSLNCYTQANNTLTVAPWFSGSPFCSCQDSANTSYACIRRVNATANFRYCEFSFTPAPPPAAAASAAGAASAAALPAGSALSSSTASSAISAPSVVTVEFFDISRDPYEMNNAAANLSPAVAAALHAELTALQTCAGSAACNAF